MRLEHCPLLLRIGQLDLPGPLVHPIEKELDRSAG